MEYIEITINNKCNLKCINCSRSLRLVPSDTRMTVEQITKFIKESIDRNIRWQRINVQGGEPTLHPDVMIILNKLLEYKERHSPATSINLYTNGFGEMVNKVLDSIPEGIHIVNSKKTGIVQDFAAMNMASKDSVLYKFADYSNGCHCTMRCGIGLEPWGYYPCVLAGSIDRIFGFDIGRKNLPANDDFLIDQLNIFCSLCGIFRSAATTKKEKISLSWEEALNNYRINKPKLSLY